jgi:hypothetical protein
MKKTVLTQFHAHDTAEQSVERAVSASVTNRRVLGDIGSASNEGDSGSLFA